MSLVSSQVFEDGSFFELAFPDLLEIEKATRLQHLAELYVHHVNLVDAGLVGRSLAFDLDPGAGRN